MINVTKFLCEYSYDLIADYYYFFLRFSECEAALMGSSFPKNKSCEEVSSDFGDSAPFALQLLGKLCR